MLYLRSFSLFLLLTFTSVPTKQAPIASQRDEQAEAEMFKPSHRLFYEAHARYRAGSLKNRRFKHRDIVPLIEKLRDNKLFDVRKAGVSAQGRDIFLVKAGTGKIKVLLWSQMHGDEPTATMAMMDLFNFLGQKGDELVEIRKQLLEDLTIYFIPMLNPDGAEVFDRRTSAGIDMNRDARSLQTPEARLLKALRDEIKPQFGFNLHDQNTKYTAGRSGKPATISFLAPAYNHEKEVNEVRGNAMKLIGTLNRVLQEYIPGQVAKYSDTHEPRGFGDNIQKAGTSVVLIESGGLKGDVEKQQIRQLNFTVLLSALQTISQKGYEAEKLEKYYEIPENGRFLFDLLVRHAQVQKGNHWCSMDLGINNGEVNYREATDFFYRSSIEDLGDLGDFFGYEELDAKGLQLIPGKVYPGTIENAAALRNLDLRKLLQQGYTSVRMHTFDQSFTHLPIRILTGQTRRSNNIGIGTNPDFVLQQNGQTRYAVINGFVYDLVKDKNGVKNGLVE
jgi:hypothetical protein